MQFTNNVVSSIKRIYSKPLYLAANAAIAILYYYLFEYIVKAQNHGVLLLISVPYPFLYVLIATSSVMLTISIYSIRNTRANAAKVSSSGLSAFATVFGGLVNGCGCSAPIMFSLFSIAFGSTEAIYLDTFVSNNGIPLITALIAANLVLIGYYLNKFAKPSCRIGRSDGHKEEATEKRR